MRREHRDQALEVPPHERLAAGEPELRDAEADEDAAPGGSISSKVSSSGGQEAEVAPEDLLRHAVDAAEVAAVGDRDPQVAQRPAEPVESRHTAEPSDGARRGSP